MKKYDKYSLNAKNWYDLNKSGLSLREIGRRHNVSHKVVTRVLKNANLNYEVWQSNEIKDISGQTFGLITAVEHEKDYQFTGKIYWKCYCACSPEKFFYVLGNDLRRGRKTHCGCNFPLKKKISGQQFGLLTAIRDTRIRENGHVVWECECKCSNVVNVHYGDLVSGHTQSCGCNRPKGENHYNWKDGSTQTRFYLRSKLSEWKNDTLKKFDNVCMISGKKENLEVHHVKKSFNDILYECLQKCKLEEHLTIGKYTQEELNQLVNTLIELHYEYGLGVVITREIHNEFHSIFGYNCTEEDFYKFVNLKETIFKK